MRISLKLLGCWLLAVSVLAAGMTLLDKNWARHGKRRIPERNLMWVGALGGAAMMLLTMLLIRHKTRHPKFMVGLPLLIVAHIALFVFVWLSDSIYLTL